MANPSVTDVWNDPDFQGLPAAEKQKVLVELDPDFRGLPPEEQAKVVGLDMGGGQSASTPAEAVAPSAPSGLDRLKKAAGRVMGTITGPMDQFGKPIASGSPLERATAPLQGLVGPSRLSASMSEPGRQAGQAVEQAIGPEHPFMGKVAGVGTAMALDPQTYASGQALAKGAVNLAGKAVTGVGKEAGALASALSGVKLRDIKTLFDDPKAVIFALSKKDAGGAISAAKKTAGVTREEEFLISKAGDRATGGARTVGEQLRPRFEAGENLTIGELVALKRAAGKLGAEAKGSEKALWAPVAQQATQQLEARAKAVASAIEAYSKSATKESFLNIVPRGSTGKPDFFRSIAALASGFGTSPIAVGAGTVAAKAGISAVKPFAKAATSAPARAVTTSAIRQYLLNQAQNGPGAR